MAMEDEYDPFDVGGQGYVADTPGYQASKGTAASQLGYDASSVYNDDSNSTYATKVNRGMSDGRDLNFDQFKTRFGMSSTNPFGQTGFTNFMSKFGAKPDYTRQLSNLPRTGTVFKGGKIKRDATGKLLGGVDAATYNAPGAVAERIMQQQYDAYRNPFNLPDVDGFDPDQRSATQAEVDAGKITRGGRTDRGSYLGPLEEVVREQSIPDAIARALMPMGTGLLDTTDPYLSSAVTPEMRGRGPQGLLGQVFQGATGVDPAQFDSKARSLGDGIRSLISGRETPAPVVQGTAFTTRPSNAPAPSFDPREIDALSAPTNALTNRNAPNYGMDPVSYDMVERQNRIPTPTSVPESIAIARANEGAAMGPYQSVDIEGPIGRRYDLPSEELDAISRNYEIDGVTGPTPEEIDGFTPQPYGPDMDAAASYRESRATPVGPDMDALGSTIDPRGNQMAPTPGEGYGMFGPRTPDDLRSMGIEPTAQDLMDMQLSPSEILRAQNRGRDTSYQGTGLPSDLRNADSVGATAASTSLENFFEQNPDLGARLMNSREGQELNDLVGRNFGGFDKSQPIQTFVDPETAEIKVQGYDARTGGAKGFNIDASEFFGKQSFGEILLDTLQAGGVEKLADESLAEKARRQNREFQEEKARREREGRSSINTLEQGLSDISFNRG